jgi:hypothetical protein
MPKVSISLSKDIAYKLTNGGKRPLNEVVKEIVLQYVNRSELIEPARTLVLYGGICIFCEHVERVEVNGVVYCSVYGKVGATLRCRNYESVKHV